MAASTAFFQSLAFFRDGITFVNDLNKSLTEISIVTGQTQQQVAALGEEYNKLAQSMGVLTRDISNATVEFYRQGLTQEEVMKRTQVATQYAKISAMDFKRSAEILTATVNSMGVDIERASDVFSYLGDATATGADEIGIAFQKVGGSAGALNIEFEKVASWIAVVSSRTREGASTIGQSIKGILARIQNMRENGFSEEDGTSVNEVAKALNAVGIALMDNEGNFRNFGTVMDELGSKWDTLSSRQQAYVSTTVAGTYQQSRFLNLMGGYKDTIPLYEKALNSAGVTTEKFNLYQQGTEAQLNKLKATWEGLWMASFDSQTIQNIVASFNAMAKVLKATVDNFGLLPPILGVAGVAILAFNGGLQRIITNGTLVLTTLKGIPFGLRTLDSALAATTLRMSLMNGATTAMTASLSGLKTAGLTTLRFAAGIALPFAAFAGIGLLISKATEKLNEFKKKQQELKKQNDDIKESYTKHGDEINRLVKQYEILNTKVESGSLSKDNEEYVQIANRLNEIFPILTRHVDERGNATLRSLDAIKQEVSYAEKLKENYAQMAVINFEESLKDQQGKFDDFIQQIEKSKKRLNGEDNTSKHASYIPKTVDEDIRLQREIIANERELQLMLSNSADYIKDKSNAFLDMSGASEKLTDENKELINSFIQEQIALADINKEGFNFEEFLKNLVNEATDLGEKLAKIPSPLKEMFNEDEANKLSKDQLSVLSSITSSVEDGYVEWENYRAILEQVGFTNVDEIIDRLSGKIKDNTKAVEDAEKATAQLLKTYDDAVSNIENLNSIINELNDEDGHGISSKSIALLIEKYPDLLAYLNDEVTLRDKITEEIQKENNIALDVATEKLKHNEQYFAKVKEGNSTLINTLAKGYSVDLENTKTLAQFKLAVEQGLIKKLGRGWADYYDIQAQAFTESGRRMLQNMSYAAAVNNPQLKAIAEYESAMKGLSSSLRGFTMDAGFGNIALSGLSDSTSKNAKEYQNSVYISDRFKQALEKVNAELEKQNQIQAKFPKHSKEYQNSIKVEIDLLKQKKKLLEDQARALEAQIKAGKIQQTGVVTTQSVSPASSSSNLASGNSASAQIWNFFKSKGFSDGIAAGIMGNLKLESGLNPNALNSSSGAFGIAQWLGGRKTQLKKFAATMGTSINDLNTQLEFLWKELNSTEKRTLNYLNGNQGASAATIAAAFDRLFERSEGTHIPQRQKYANQFYSQYSGSAGAYVASTTTGSQEAAKAMESVDQAKSELIQLKLDALEIDGLISQLQVDLVNAEFAKNERTIRQIESHLKIYEDNFEEAVKGQWMYEVSLQNQINLLNNKRKILQEEQKYISTQIRTNKGLTQAQKSELEMRNLDIRDSLIELNNTIKELSWEKTLHGLVKFTSEIEKMDYKLRLSKQNQALFNKESEGYASELNSQRGFILDKIVAMEKEKIAIDQIRASQNLDQQQKKELNDRYLELKVSILEAQDALQELQNEASQAKLDNVLSQIDKVVDGISRKLKEIDNRIHVTDPEDEKAMIALYNDRLDALLEQRKAALANIESLEAISKELAGNDEALKQNADEIQKWKDSLSDVDISIFDQKKVIEDYYEDIANSYVEAMKEAYEAEKKVKLDNLDKIRKAEEKAHNDRMKEMDEESKAIDEQYNKQLRALNDQESADDYAKELSKKQTSAQELQAKINALSMDDSEWAKKEKERLEKELAEMQEDIEKYKNDRALELRRQSLEDEKNAKQDQLDSEREAENKAWEERQKALEEQRQQIEQYYEDLLENEREWAKMREDIMNGNVDYYKTKLEEMAKFVSDNGKIIGDSIAQNISDALNKAKENIGSITESIKDLFATVDKESKQQDSNAEQTANDRKKNEEEPPTTGKLVINKPIKLWTRKNGKLEYVRGLNPGEVYKVYDYDEKYGGQFNVGNNHWVTDMAGYVKFQKYHDGGIVGGKGSRLTELANKLFNEKPNEQTVTALKRELFAPEKNMPNFFNNIKNFSSSLVKPTGTPSVVYNLDLTIGSVTGNKDGGKVVFGEVVKGLKKMGKL